MNRSNQEKVNDHTHNEYLKWYVSKNAGLRCKQNAISWCTLIEKSFSSHGINYLIWRFKSLYDKLWTLLYKTLPNNNIDYSRLIWVRIWFIYFLLNLPKMINFTFHFVCNWSIYRFCHQQLTRIQTKTRLWISQPVSQPSTYQLKGDFFQTLVLHATLLYPHFTSFKILCEICDY